MVLVSSLFVALLFLHKATCEIYHVVPTEESDCPDGVCKTLTQIAANSSEYFTENSTVFISPGKHYLNTTLTFSNINQFTLISNSTLSTTLVCADNGRLAIVFVEDVTFKGIQFSGCHDNIIQSVPKCVIEECLFEAHGAGKTVLHLIESWLVVEDTSFLQSKQVDSYNEVAYPHSSIDHDHPFRGAILGVRSNITLKGNTSFVNFTQSTALGGALSIFQSRLYFNGVCKMVNNNAMYGGAIYAIQSEILVNGAIRLKDNKAGQNGGGLYLHQSKLNCNTGSNVRIMENHAFGSGGGIFASSSSINMIVNINESSRFDNRSILEFVENEAAQGGALSLNKDSKLYVFESFKEAYRNGCHSECIKVNTVSFVHNTAEYGGAVYVDDEFDSDSCSDSLFRECFLQVFPLNSLSDVRLCTIHLDFSNNTAEIAGSVIFGGHFDKCITSPFSQYSNPVNTFHGHTYLANISNGVSLQSISSNPAKLCLCVNNSLNCHSTQVNVVKGHDFKIDVVAFDQVGHPVNSIIQARLTNLDSDLSEGQVMQSGNYTTLTFSVASQHDTEALLLHTSTNHCNELRVDINFLPCTCPLGFQSSETNAKRCVCQCHSDIQQYVECDSSTNSFNRISNVWIGGVTYGSENNTGYLIFPYCPFDNCVAIGNNESVSLDQPDGSDAQCAFNRTGLLCGFCPRDLSLSLGTSRCLLCPNYWPALFVLITLSAILAGAALVTIVLVLNLTVAAGTVNALIFFANIVATHRSILLPFQHPNFATVFISWFNLEIGIDACYFEGMNAYTKTWLQFVFPTYIIALVVLTITVCAYSSKFSNLIGKKNPVAALATMVLLAYAKYLQTVIAIMVFGILRYPDGSTEVVWLHDPTVKYFVGKHSALFIAAILVLVMGAVYIFLLLTWQWLVRLPKWWIFKWVNNVKLHALMEAYHAPFTSKYRFWPGFLLLIRACLCLIDALNTSSNPQVAFTSITFTIAFIITLKGLIGSRIYKKWTHDVLEMGVLFNLLLFSIFMWYTFDTDGNQGAIVYISVSITFVLLLLVIMYHIYAYTGVSSKLKGNAPSKLEQDPPTINVSTDNMLDTRYELPTPSPPTYTVVESPTSSL